MLPQIVTVGPIAAANAALIAASATPVSGTPVTLTGTQPDKARKILLTYGNEGSARTMKITGTNVFGNVISETLAVPSGAGGTVATIQDFLTVTQALPGGGGWTAAMTIGTNGVASSPWMQVNSEIDPVNITYWCNVIGTANYSIEETGDDPNNTLGNAANVPALPYVHGTVTAKAAAFVGNSSYAIRAWRLTLNSGTGTANCTGIQAGNIN